MSGMLVIIFQAVLWPAVSASALFTVNVEQSAYEAELHGDVKLVCVFSSVKKLSDLSVIWSRVSPKPDLDVYRLERGQENHNYTSAVFIKRAQLITEQLKENRAVLHLKKLQIRDSGTYRCIVMEGDELDYKQITLNVTAPYSPILKRMRKVGTDAVELSCESQGFPAAQVMWSDAQTSNLTKLSNTSSHATDEDLLLVISRLTVKRELVNKYNCSFITRGEIQQTATFSIPDEILPHSSPQFMWIVAVLIVLLAIAFISVILRRRINGQKNRQNEMSQCDLLFPRSCTANTDYLLTVNENSPQTCDKTSEEASGKASSLRSLLTQQYSPLHTHAEATRKLLSYELLNKEGQPQNFHSVIPDQRETVLLLGEAGSGKTSLAQILSSCWAGGFPNDPFDISWIRLLLLADFSRAEGDFEQILQSSMNLGKASELIETLMGPEESLLILDGYKEGNESRDKALEEFLSGRKVCRVLVTSRPGQCPALEERAGTVLQIRHRPEEPGA